MQKHKKNYFFVAGSDPWVSAKNSIQYIWFDLRIFIKKEFLIPRVEKMALNENLENYFEHIWQAVFCPVQMPPDVEVLPAKECYK